MKRLLFILIPIVSFLYEHPKLLTAFGTLTGMGCHAQFADVYNPTDKGCYYPGTWSNNNLYAVFDSTDVHGYGFEIYTPFKLTKYTSSRNDGTPNGVLWTNNTGDLKRSPLSSITFSASQVGGLSNVATSVIRQTGGASTAGSLYTSTEQNMIQVMWNALRIYGLLS